MDPNKPWEDPSIGQGGTPGGSAVNKPGLAEAAMQLIAGLFGGGEAPAPTPQEAPPSSEDASALVELLRRRNEGLAPLGGLANPDELGR